MKITQIPMGTHNAQLTCYLQDPCTEMPALDRCPAILIFPGGAYAFCSDREADPVALAFLNAGYNAFVLRYSVSQNCPVEEVYTNAFAEAQEAMDYCIRTQRPAHRPGADRVVGFSAGGHLAARWAPWAGSVLRPCCWATLCSASRARRWAWSCRTCCSRWMTRLPLPSFCHSGRPSGARHAVPAVCHPVGRAEDPL